MTPIVSGWCSDADITELRLGYTTVRLEHPQQVAAALTATDTFFSRTQGTGRGRPSGGSRVTDTLPEPRGRETAIVESSRVPAGLEPVVSVWQQLDGIGASVLKDVAVSLGLPPLHFVEVLDDGGPLSEATAASLLRLARCPPTSATALAGHDDVGLISIVASRGSPSLEVLDLRSMAWHRVEEGLPPDRVVVMTGLALERLTGGAISACHHRLGPTPAGRISLAFQSRPRPDARLAIPTTLWRVGLAEPTVVYGRGREFMDALYRGAPSLSESSEPGHHRRYQPGGRCGR